MPDADRPVLVPCRHSDAAWVRDLREAVLRPQVEALTPWDEAAQARRFARDFDPDHAWIVRVRGVAVGCAALRTTDGHASLSSLYVLPGRQGGGIGAAVVGLLQDRAAALGLTVRLTVLRGSPARRLYERCGFVLDGTDRWEDSMSWAPAPCRAGMP